MPALLKKRNLKEFYTGIATVHQIFKTIADNNQKLEEQYLVANPAPKIEKKLEGLTPEQEYILAHVKTDELFKAIFDLLVFMNVNKFDKHSSVPHNVETTKAGKDSYDLTSRTNLYDHTLNCAVCSIEVTINQPQIIREITILLCLLHDFGKHPKIESRYPKQAIGRHDKISALFAQDFLKMYRDEQVFLDVVFATLDNHHEKDEKVLKTTIYLDILKESDEKARTMEQAFIKMRLKQ